jgi:S-methylmethionine-dependent homocysteine/selenocysteine methylase
MSDYKTLETRLAAKEVVILDGAVGTQLQKMGAPMNSDAWAATALQTHPYTVRLLHENYIRAGVDIITVNSYSAARHNLVPIGLGDMTRELNLRAVVLAQEARDRCAKERPVYIAGSVSNYGLRTGSETTAEGAGFFTHRVPWTEAASKANLREQAEILAESGVDLLLVESTGGTTHRKWVLEACLATGLPVWVGFKCHQDEGGGAPKVGYHSDEPLTAKFAEVVAMGGSVVTIFHSPIAATDAALPLIRSQWKGPIGIYPEAERKDYVAVHKDAGEPDHVSPAEFVAKAKEWVNKGVQIIGGCCGIELEHIQPLRAALPKRVPSATS